MSSGYFDTIFFQNAVPISITISEFSTLSVLSIGSNGYMRGYTFYDYQHACGFSDTSTLTTALTSSFTSTLATIQSNTVSSFSSVNSNIQYNGKIYVSTIPFLQWISSTTITDYPFYYPSSFTTTYIQPYTSTVYSNTSNVINDLDTYFTPNYISTNLNSTFIFNFVSTPNVSTLISTTLTGNYSSIQTFMSSFIFSTFNTTLVSSFVNILFTSTVTSNFVSTGVLAKSYPYDFISRGLLPYSSNSMTSNIWLGDGLSNLINSRQYTVYVDTQYSAYISTSTTFSWISTIGVFNSLDDPSYIYGNKGVTFTTRLGNNQYSHIHKSIPFNPLAIGQIPSATSNFHLELSLQSSIARTVTSGCGCRIVTIDTSVYTDVFFQGQNNITFTLVPIF